MGLLSKRKQIKMFKTPRGLFMGICAMVILTLLLMRAGGGQTAQAEGTFVKGINLNGNAVTVDGNAWLSYSDALSSGFATTAGKSFNSNITWSPSTDTGTSRMLNSVIYQSGGSFTMTQNIANGNYNLYFWLTENYANNARSVNIKLEGNLVSMGVGRMSKNTWAKYGPYNVTVNDGTLNIEFVRVSGDPQCAGLAIFTSGGTVNTPTPTNTATPSPTATSTATSTATATPQSQTVFAVNCGGGAFTSADGTRYEADKSFSGGSTYTSTTAIAGTTDDPLYQSERYGNCTYNITVPNGYYLVTLHFAETYQTQAGKRSFDVLMEGTERISALDIYAKAGASTAYVSQNYVTVNDGALNLQFVSKVENAKINAIKVSLAGPGADFSYSPAKPVANQLISFDASASNDSNGTITTYSWDFGDHSSGAGQTATHAYPAVGDYQVTLTVTDNDGNTGSQTKTVKVYSGDPVVEFSINPTAVKPGDPVTVDASASFDANGTISGYKVDFGDGTIASDAVTTHKYASEGEYTITVTVTDNDGNTASLAKKIAVIQKTRLRVIMSTDFPTLPGTNSDPDDVQSMVRFLLYSNEFDIEALIASAATTANIADKTHIYDALAKYALVYQNLRRHDPLYPTPDTLRAVTFQGRNGTWGKGGTTNIGAGKDSEASEAIIKIIDKPDPRPVYIGVWGDCSNIAQAIWKVQNTRSAAELDKFLSKIRIHQIATQDGSIGWLLSNFPRLFIIHSARTYQGMFGGSDPISNLAWINTNIRNNHGSLCAVYPPAGMGCSGVCEGDSPSFLWLVSANRGLNNPDDPTQPSWGGQFRRDGSTNHYLDGPGGSTISKWRSAYQKEFAERADWCIQ